MRSDTKAAKVAAALARLAKVREERSRREVSLARAARADEERRRNEVAETHRVAEQALLGPSVVPGAAVALLATARTVHIERMRALDASLVRRDAEVSERTAVHRHDAVRRMGTTRALESIEAVRRTDALAREQKELEDLARHPAHVAPARR